MDEACGRYLQRREAALQLQTQLLDYRLYWERFGQALQDRDVMLLDAQNIRIRRQLLMLDLEQLRTPIPILIPQGGNPPDRSLFDKERGKDEH